MTTKNHKPTSEHSQADQCPSCGSYCDIFQDLDDQDYCNDCRAETPETRRAETLEKFNNGEQRYEDDPRFKEAVDSLAARIGVYAVLDKALNELRVLRRLQSETVAQNHRLAEELDIMKNGFKFER